MSKLNTHVAAIKEILSKGRTSSSFSYSDGFIAHLLKKGKSTLIADKLKKENYISELNYTTLCLKLENGTYTDCNCIGSKCQIKKSINILPNHLKNTLEVSTLSGKIIDSTTIDTNNYSNYGLISKKNMEYVINNKKIIILNNKDIEYISIKAVFTDPEELKAIQLCSSSNSSICKNIDSDFPIDDELVEALYKKVLFLITSNYGAKQDNITNNIDESHV
jgi:hypothetical protein